MSDLILLGGSAHPRLAAAVAEELATKPGDCTVERFPDGEVAVHLNESVRRRNVFVIQPTCTPVNDHVMELVAFADACRRAGAARITAVVPYFGYARSDKRGEHRDPIMAAAVANILQVAGIDHLITVDPHSAQLEACFRIPVDVTTAVPTLAFALRGRLPRRSVIVAPDVGAVRLATRYAEILERPVVVLHKRRTTAHETVVTHVVGDVRNRPALIIDDMISTGGTIRRSIDALLAAGARPEIVVAATHALLLPGARELLDLDAVGEVRVTDTIPPPTGWDELRVVSIAPLLASAIRRAAGSASERDLREGKELFMSRKNIAEKSKVEVRRGMPEPSTISLGEIDDTGEVLAQLHADRDTSVSADLSGGDVDARWDQGESSGEETVAGSAPTPDQDIVDEIGEAIGVTYAEGEPLRVGRKEEERDEHRWELDPASAEDYRTRTAEAAEAEPIRHMRHSDQYKRSD